LSKSFNLQPNVSPKSRPIALAIIAPAGMSFHRMAVPGSHDLLILCSLVASEIDRPIPGDQLDYIDPFEGWKYLSEVAVGSLFHWPKDLVDHILPTDYQADLQSSLHGDDSDSPEEYSDSVLSKYRRTTRKLERGW
jgi:hypothetical protein